MLIIDVNNMFFRSAMEHFSRTRDSITANNVRGVIVSELSRTIEKFGKNREIVMASDTGPYWRKQVFPPYKAKRAKDRDNSKFDFEAFFPVYTDITKEIQENFPLKWLSVPSAEADDIIGILSQRGVGQGKDVLIWSSDTDHLQLQLLDKRIKQFSYVKRKNITPRTEGYTLFEHICRGDSGDGIPNILNPADHFILEEKKRQKSLTAKMLAEWEQYGISEPEKFCDAAMLDRFIENRNLIDYRMIPSDLAFKIVETYEDAPVPKGKMFNYLVKYRLVSKMAGNL